MRYYTFHSEWLPRHIVGTPSNEIPPDDVVNNLVRTFITELEAAELILSGWSVNFRRKGGWVRIAPGPDIRMPGR